MKKFLVGLLVLGALSSQASTFADEVKTYCYCYGSSDSKPNYLPGHVYEYRPFHDGLEVWYAPYSYQLIVRGEKLKRIISSYKMNDVICFQADKFYYGGDYSFDITRIIDPSSVKVRFLSCGDRRGFFKR